MNKYNPAGSTPNNPGNRKRTSQKRVVRDGSKKKVKKVTSYTLYIPCNIDIDDLLNRHPIDVPNARDKLVLLLHQIHAVPAFSKEEENEANNGFTILHSTYLQSLIDEYAVLFRWLIRQGIIEVDNRYVLNDRSKGYRFCLKYRTEVKKVHITTWTLIRRLINGKSRQLKQPALYPQNLLNLSPSEFKKAYLGYSWLAESRLSFLNTWFNDGKLTIHSKEALEYLNEQLNEDLKSPHVKFPMRKFNLSKMIVESLADQVHKFHVDDTAGRLHTFLTCLKSELRAFLRYDGKPLSAADIKNSQPLLSLVFLDYNLFVNNRMKERMEIYNQGNDNSNIYIMLGDLIKRNSTNSDTIRYKELVLSGEMYLWFGKQLQELGILDSAMNDDELRTKAKRGLLKSLFNRNQAIGYERIQWAFKKIFPSVYEIFELVKGRNYKTLACVLQNLEAEIVLHESCTELAINHQLFPLFTIHDSIASTTDNIDKINEVLSKHLFEAIGEVVKPEVEHWDEHYFERKKSKKQTNPVLAASVQEKINVAPEYGYFDYNLLLIPYYISLTEAAKQLGLKRNKFMEGLRKLNIISEFNLPAEEFEEAKLLLKREFTRKIKRFRTLTLVSTKVTDEGLEFLKQLAEVNPDLFPKKRVRIKRS